MRQHQNVYVLTTPPPPIVNSLRDQTGNFRLPALRQRCPIVLNFTLLSDYMEGTPSSLLQRSDRQLEDPLFSYFTGAAGSLMIRGLASSCRSFHELCWTYAAGLRLQNGSTVEYKAAITRAAGSPRLASAILQCCRSSPVDESPASVTLHLKALPALRDLHITSNAITAADVRAVAQLTALTSLHLQDAQYWQPCSARGSNASSVAELQPLAWLTGLQQLSITSWQPLGTHVVDWDAAFSATEPAAGGSLCLPASGMLTHFSMAAIPTDGIVRWLPSMLACTALQHLQLHIPEAIDNSGIHNIIKACAEHLTGLTTLQVLVASTAYAQVVPCHAGQSISRLQRLQHLQIDTDDSPGNCTYTCYELEDANAVFRCAALRSLGMLYIHELDDGNRYPVPAGAVLPHLTELRFFRLGTVTYWPADAFPNLRSVYLHASMEYIPDYANIPGSSSITELTLNLYYESYYRRYPQLDAAEFQNMALALPRLRKLQVDFEGPVCSRNGQEQRALPWMQALSAFTQLHELGLNVPVAACACRHCSNSLSLLVPAAGVLRALCQLPQLQQVTLSGSAWDVSALFVVGLEVGLTQLSSIRLEGCCGRGAAQQAKQAAIRKEMAHVAAGLRAGLQLEYIE